MNPDKLFDYLDGKLSPADRQDLEEKLMSDAQLRAQFNIAREIQRSGSGKRETIVPVDDATAERGGKLGRRIATAAIGLVFLNVLIGLAVITAKRSTASKKTDPQEAAIRQQLKESLGAAAQNAMPAPSLHDDEINLTAARAEWEKLATDVIAAAEASGGSAIKDAAETATIVTARIPRARLADFRKTVLGPSAAPAAASATADETLTVQIRIAEAAP